MEDLLFGGVGNVLFSTSDNFLQPDNFLDSIKYGGDKEFMSFENGGMTTRIIKEEDSMEEDVEGEEYVVIDDDKLLCSVFGNSGIVPSDGGATAFQQQQTLKLIRKNNSYIITAAATEESSSPPAGVSDEEDTSSSHSCASFVVDASPQLQAPSHQQQQFQELKLSDEEKRLLSKEGIKLPTHYPLTKFEERELKRIRRKIRNKISAQDSRKRKKEFLDKLQQRVSEVEDEKSSLAKKVRSLESANAKLTAQVKRLQMALSQKQNAKNNGTTNSTAATTTLLVLILSLALVVLPTTMRGGNHKNQHHKSVAIVNNSLDQKQNFVGVTQTLHSSVRSRSMLPVVDDIDISEDDSEEYDAPRNKRRRLIHKVDEVEGLAVLKKKFQETFQENRGGKRLGATLQIIDDKVYD